MKYIMTASRVSEYEISSKLESFVKARDINIEEVLPNRSCSMRLLCMCLMQDKTIRVWDVENADRIPVVMQKKKNAGSYRHCLESVLNSYLQLPMSEYIFVRNTCVV